MRARRISDERGIALAVAIFALVVMGALVAGTFFVGRLEQQAGHNTFYVAQAAEAAQAGIERELVEASGATYDAMVAGVAPTQLSTLTLDANLTASRSVRRLTNSLWLIRAVGTRANAGYGGQATRTLAALVRLNKAPITVNAGLTRDRQQDGNPLQRDPVFRRLFRDHWVAGDATRSDAHSGQHARRQHLRATESAPDPDAHWKRQRPGAGDDR